MLLRERDASGSNSNERTDQTKLFRNERPWEMSTGRSNRTEKSKTELVPAGVKKAIPFF